LIEVARNEEQRFPIYDDLRYYAHRIARYRPTVPEAAPRTELTKNETGGKN
jgi:hypothetical protein